jgi:DNA-binding helix-hairpin-helix protein with protein kinase domain
LIFRLLMMGRHPYGGVNYPRGTDDTDLARIVQHLPFAYGSRAEELGIRRPPQSIALATLGSELAVLFEEAFERRESRPAPEFWVRGLERFGADLVACRNAPLHRFVGAAGPCPWCALEREGYVAFVGAATAGGFPAYDTLADRRWLASVDLGAASQPQIVPERPPLRSQGPQAMWFGWTVWSTVAAGAAAADIGLATTHGLTFPTFGLFCVAAWNLRRHAPPERRTRRVAKLRERLAAAEAQWQRAIDAWRSPAVYARANDTLAEFRALLEFVERPKADLARRMLALEARKRELQLEAYLAGFTLAACKLPSINARVRESLATYGIATASDVRRLDRLKIPDVGPGRRLVLLDWREKLARRFTYDPAAALPRQAIAAVEAEHADAYRTALQRLPTLRAAATELLARAEEARRIASDQLTVAANELGRARRKLADLGERYA